MTIPSLLDLVTEQQAVIDLPFDGNHIVTGEPGSGKTVMAVYRAWMLATAGRDVTLFTRANLLHQYVGQMAPELTETLGITTYHRWVGEFWRARFRTDPPLTDTDGWSYDWVEMQRDCIRHQVESTAHLVIDEGQNLPLGFYHLCRILGVRVTVCADANQLIGDEESTVEEIRRILAVRTDPVVLQENHRNSREIAMLATEFHERKRGDTPLPASAGRKPVVLAVSSPESLVVGISRYFSAHRDRSIGIICRSTRTLLDIKSEIARIGLSEYAQAYIHNDRHRNVFDFSRRPIRIVTTASMKGLEFDSVFVPDLDAYTEDPTSVSARLRFFVLCTRAREDLHFAHLGTQEPAILSNVPDRLLTRYSG
ncbi:hypothetical protein ADK76_09785 [Streptomyces griseoflavus]|uniref:AAA family ATPase n=1 Tax=Streptomyces rimosus TaxID=1927 RepID=UPI0004C87B59|nr:AAA family ATPase [Streptomyces rimosus]KOG64248.1 hypothetical protein ADK76_09785 [Streptomyces griseoflavus]